MSEAFDQTGRLLAIGDIHGCQDHLRHLLDLVDLQAEDRMVFLGDYIDRGPDSKGVLDDLIDLARKFPRTVFLKGNHEQMYLDYLAGKNTLDFLLNGGAATISSYRKNGDFFLPEEHRRFLEELKLIFVEEDFIFVHAGLRPHIPLEKQQEEDLLWIRRDFLYSDYDWGKVIVFGHTPQQKPLVSDQCLGLDTGAVYGRVLTCCEVRTRQFWHWPLLEHPLPPEYPGTD